MFSYFNTVVLSNDNIDEMFVQNHDLKGIFYILFRIDEHNWNIIRFTSTSLSVGLDTHPESINCETACRIVDAADGIKILRVSSCTS